MGNFLKYINTKNVPYSEIIILAISLIFGFFSFLSLNFYTLGQTFFSLQWAIIIGLGLGSLAYLAKRFKQVHCNFKVYFVLEILTLVIFSLAFFTLSFTIFSHYFNVTANKAQIQSELKKAIYETQSLFEDYEDYCDRRIELYKQTLQSVAQNKTGSPSSYIAYGFDKSGVSDSLQIENKIFIMKQDLFPPEYVTIKNQNAIWYKKSSTHVENWKAIGIVRLVNLFGRSYD